MNDVGGNSLVIGDEVATTVWKRGAKTANYLQIVEVVGFTPQKIRLKTSNGKTITKFPEQVALLPRKHTCECQS